MSSRWLQLVATPVKYNHNSIENISTLSYRVTVVLIARKLDIGLSHTYIAIAKDDRYKFYAKSIITFTFMFSMINKDMHHMLMDPMKKEDPVRIYKAIQEHLKGGKYHDVESARRKLNAGY